MKNSVSYRIRLIMSEFGYNKNSFSKKIGLSNNVTIGRIINEDRSPSYDVLYKIIQTFGNIDAEWLLTGAGKMYKSDKYLQYTSEPQKKYERPPPKDKKVSEDGSDYSKISQDKYIEMLEERIKELKEHIETLKRNADATPDTRKDSKAG